MNRCVAEGDYNALPVLLSCCAQEARKVLTSWPHPQMTDFAMLRCYYPNMLSCSRPPGPGFLAYCGHRTIEPLNLPSCAPPRPLSKGAKLLTCVLMDGGTIRPYSLRAAALPACLEDL